MVKIGLDPDRVIYEVYSSVGVPVACDFWKLGKRDIGSYGLRRDGDSLVITIRLRENNRHPAYQPQTYSYEQ